MTSRDTTARQTVIFLHLPRTAGTTLHRIIERQVRPEGIFSIGWTEQESVQAYRGLSQARKAEIRMIRGHLAFGLHEFVPGPSTYFTLLRNPIERVISYYYFIRRTADHYLYDFALSEATTLEEFVESRAHINIDNAQTRMLSGKWFEPGFGECTEDILEMAKENLQEHFAVVGLTERYDETLVLLKKAFGWRNVFYARQNVTASRPRQAELPSTTLDLIAQHNQLDRELYRYAVTLFEEGVRQQGPSFAREVERYQAANRLASPFIHTYYELRKHSARIWFRNQLQRIRP
jgi:hypothetical protein